MLLEHLRVGIQTNSLKYPQINIEIVFIKIKYEMMTNKKNDESTQYYTYILTQ